MKLYRIKDWQTAYETHETRKYVALKWVPIPNKHDGLTFRQIGTERNAAQLFAGWVLLVQLASKSDRENRGLLIRNGRPMQAREMALVTGFPEKLFTVSLDYFAQPSVGWLDVEDLQIDLPLSPASPGESPGAPVSSAENTPDERNGIEGIERKEKRAAPVASPVPLPFASPLFTEAWTDFERHRSEIKKPLKPTSRKLALSELASMGEHRAIMALRHTIAKGWQGIREPELNERSRVAAPMATPPPDGPKGWRETLTRLRPGNSFHGAWMTLPESMRKEIENQPRF